MQDDPGEYSATIRNPFRNDAEEAIPAYGVLRITGTVEVVGRQFLKAAKPNTYGSQLSHYVNGPLPVASGKYGECMVPLSPIAAHYDSADGTPAFGESWGPRASTWKLKKNTGGFKVLGLIDSTQHLVLVQQEPFLTFRGKANADIAAGALGTASIYYQSALGTYSDSSVDTPTNSVFNALDETVESGAWIECGYAPFGSTEGWRITQGDFECP